MKTNLQFKVNMCASDRFHWYDAAFGCCGETSISFVA